ncbi:hypothetical protein ACFLRZ_03815 [Bacteroidota bacterium]
MEESTQHRKHYKRKKKHRTGYFYEILYELGLAKKRKPKSRKAYKKPESSQEDKLSNSFSELEKSKKSYSYFNQVLYELGLGSKPNVHHRKRIEKLPDPKPVIIPKTEPSKEIKKRKKKKNYAYRLLVDLGLIKDKRYRRKRHKKPVVAKPKLTPEEELRIKKRKYRIKRMQRKWRKQESAFYQFFRSINIPREGKLGFKVYAIIAINSTILFIFTFHIVNFINKLVTTIVANHYKVLTIMYYHKMEFPIGYTSPLWTFESVRTIFSSGPIACLIVGIIFYRFFYMIRKGPGLLKLFFLWMAFHSLNMFFGAFTSGVITTSGFGYVPQWFYFSTVANFVGSMVALSCLAAIGFYSRKSFLQCAMSYRIISHEYRLLYLISQALFPYVLGTVILIMLKMPNNPIYEGIIHGTMLLMIIPLLLNYKENIKTHLYEKTDRIKIDYWYFVLSIVIFVIIRYGFSSGISFGVKNVII